MKNITKTLLVLVSSLSIAFAAQAGEVNLTGSAKASYTIGGTDDSMGKGIGISNELSAAASGELDNGMSWKWQTERPCAPRCHHRGNRRAYHCPMTCHQRCLAVVVDDETL